MGVARTVYSIIVLVFTRVTVSVLLRISITCLTYFIFFGMDKSSAATKPFEQTQQLSTDFAALPDLHVSLFRLF